MKILNKLIALVLLNSFVFGAESTTPETQYTKGVNQSTSCQIECPPLKEGFIGRIADFEYETGTTTCYVYSLKDVQNAIGKVVNINQHCSKELINPVQTPSIVSNTGGVNSHLITLKDKFNDLYTNTGTTSYINLPKYMVAGLMADDSIIDISTSITTNEVKLNSNYTVAPNITSSVEEISDATLISRTKDALANSVTFVINFLSMSDKTLLTFKVSLFLFVGALSIILLLSQKATKKISKVGDHEDVAEKVLFGVLSVLIFFFTTNRVDTTTGQISQTGYQQVVRPFLYLGVETADKLAETATSSVLRYKFANVGVNLQEDLQSFNNLYYKEKEKNIFFKGMLNKCKNTYNTESTSQYVKLLNSNFLFPPSETILTKGYGNDEKRQINFYTKGMVNDENSLKTTDVPTVSYCYQIERAVLDSNAFLNNLKFKIDNYKNAVSVDMERKINLITDLTYKNVAELGFISIVNLGTTSLAFDQFSLLGENKNQQKNYEFTMEEFRNQTGYEIQGFAKGEDVGGVQGMVNVAVNDVLTNAPYYAFVPFADNILNYINRAFNPIKQSAGAMSGTIESFLSLIPFVGSGLAKGIDKIVTNGAEFMVDSLVGYISIWLITMIISILPLIAIIGAGILVIAFYFLSVEILYLVIPFASIFAFSTGNLDIMKNLIKNTFLLAVKPVLIVVSVLMALFVADMLNSLNQVIVTSMFEPLFALSNDLSSETVSNVSSAFDVVKGMGAGGIFIFLKSTMLLASSFITVFVCFYLVFNGANIMLDLLGMRDGGFDVGGVIGDKVENKHSVSKMNTVI